MNLIDKGKLFASISNAFQKWARSLCLDVTSGLPLGGRNVLLCVSLDLLLKSLPLIVIHIALFKSSGRVSMTAAQVACSAFALASVCIYAVAEIAIVMWWAHREHFTLLLFGIIEISDWLSNLALFASAGVRTSKVHTAILAVFTVMSSVVLALQFWITRWQLVEGFVTWDMKWWGAPVRKDGMTKTSRKRWNNWSVKPG